MCFFLYFVLLVNVNGEELLPWTDIFSGSAGKQRKPSAQINVITIVSIHLNSDHWSGGQTVKQQCQYWCVVYSSTQADGLTCFSISISNSPDIHRLIHRARCKHQHAGRECTCSHISTAERQKNIKEKVHLVRYTLQCKYVCEYTAKK